jgi:malonyl-CoA/methylmalonyl-CoA synthetase
MPGNLYRLFEGSFPANPGAPFLESPSGDSLTYGQLHRRSARLAHRLVALGVRPGDRVAVQVEKSPWAVILYLACLRAGAVYLPLNPAYPPPEVEYFLEDGEPVLFVTAPGAADRRSSGPRIRTLGEDGDGTLLEGLESESEDFTPVSRTDDDPAAILYTSGTTGRSKGAVITHGNLASNAVTLHQVWGWREGDVLLHALPIFHVHGLFVALHCALLNGSPCLFLPRFDPEEVVGLLPRATVFMGVPTYYIRLLEHGGLNREACRGMRLFLSGSAPLSLEVFRRFEATTGHRIVERYGMTETGMITSNRIEAPVPGSVGPPLPGVEVRLADTEGGSGAVGVLEVRGPNVFSGYWRQPEKTAQEMRPDGFFSSGDLARLDEAGNVFLVGRAKELIITGGYNVYPKEVEDRLDALPGVAESAVFGVPHPDFGEAVVAAVRGDTGATLVEAEMRAALKEQLASYKVPKRILFLDALPRNAMGKVQKVGLSRQHAAIFKA